ncbi:CxxC-x17-CxxC domain-containing protein [Dehalogenimonas sp. 4OHTPN]|uniref:CxxC-x17-CxxC domain-containing protein n=1 Tax=Dehalogenimonas sp. 4OHTPN TaxID=3166643 RepID=A0AAU8G9I5_9CHLR
MAFEAKTISCCDCGSSFIFTIEDQEFFQTKGFSNVPKRCPACRSARKTERTGVSNYTSSYNTRQMFPATCSDCGKATQVPFEPRNGKPVYCSDCYRKVSANR